MLITFTTKAHPDVVMFGDIAGTLLQAMGEKEQPPGILRGENIKKAANKLRAHLQLLPAEHSPRDEEIEPPENEVTDKLAYVGLKKRALPLLELMDAAYLQNKDMIWR